MAHVGTECLAWPLIDTIAVVELRERGTEVIGIVAGSVRGQLVKDRTDGVQEANQSLGKFEFFFLLHDEGGGLGSHLDLAGSQLCSVGLQQNK